MMKIKRMADDLMEELEGAQKYAECYVAKKASGITQWASRYKSMSEDELRHAQYIHEAIVQEIEQLRTVFTPPADMMNKWDKDHKHYVDKAAWIRKMLEM